MYYTLFQDDKPRMDLVHTRLLSIRKQLEFVGRLMKEKGEVLRISRSGKDFQVFIGVKGKANPRITFDIVKQ